MYKLGIWRSEKTAHTRALLGKTRQFSYSLLKTGVSATPAEIARFENVIRTVHLSSGICRTTYPERFRDLDPLVQTVLERIFPADRSLVIHDLAASDGLLSMLWAKRIFEHFPGARMTASDVFLYFTEAVWNSRETYILEPDGTPIQYTRAPFVVPLHAREHPAYLVNALVRSWARRRVRQLQSCASSVRWDGVPDHRVVSAGKWSLRQIPLVHPRALSFAQNGRFTIAEVDAFSALPWKCDVIRAMNVYQPYALSSEQIRQGVYVSLDALRDGGIFIAGRTLEKAAQRNDVTVFQKTHGRSHVLERLGKGFEFEGLAAEYDSGRRLAPEHISAASDREVGRRDNSAGDAKTLISPKRAVPAAGQPCIDQVASPPNQIFSTRPQAASASKASPST